MCSFQTPKVFPIICISVFCFVLFFKWGIGRYYETKSYISPSWISLFYFQTVTGHAVVPEFVVHIFWSIVILWCTLFKLTPVKCKQWMNFCVGGCSRSQFPWIGRALETHSNSFDKMSIDGKLHVIWNAVSIGNR